MKIEWLNKNIEYEKGYDKNIVDFFQCLFWNETTIFLPIKYSGIESKLKNFVDNLQTNLSWNCIMSIRNSIKIQKEKVSSTIISDKKIIDNFNKFKIKLNAIKSKRVSDEKKLTKIIICFFKFIELCKTSLTRIIKIIRSQHFDNLFCKLICLYLEDEIVKINKLSIENSKNYEIQVNEYLTSLNIKFKTEEESRNESQNKKLLATPDFLINGILQIKIKNEYKLIKWIDVKNYFGININYIKESLLNQGKKYIKYFGPGVFIFRYGFAENLTFDELPIYILTYNPDDNNISE